MSHTPRTTTRRDCATCRLALPLPVPHKHYVLCTWVPPAWPSNVMQMQAERFGMQAQTARMIPKYELEREPTRLKPCDTWEPADAK